MNKTGNCHILQPMRRLAGIAAMLWAFLLAAPVSLRAQMLSDSLNDSSLSHFFSDPLHLQFHPEQHPFDSLFSAYVPSVDMETIEDRVACLDLEIPLVVNKSVCGFIHYFTVRKRNYTQTMLERKNYYFPIFEYYLRKYEMPDQLKYLAIVESGLNYRAKSKVGALGLWQFMPGTGRDFRLGQSALLDQRQNPWLATEAACKFLKSLYGTFHDWELALAAYNCGPGNVMKALRRSGKRGFWEIYPFLPQETRSYVPQFHAVVYSMNFAREHNIRPDIDSVLMAVPLDTFRVNKTCDLRKLECLLGMQPKGLQHHNPEVKTNVFPGGVLLVPGSHSGLLAANFDVFVDSSRTTIPPMPPVSSNVEAGIYLKKGVRFRKIAAQKGWNEEEFCRINQLKGDRIRRSGKYLIPASASKDSGIAAKKDSSLPSMAEKNHGNGKLRSSKPHLQVIDKHKNDLHALNRSDSDQCVSDVTSHAAFHSVEKGEGLFSIARKYGLSLDQIKDLNPGIGSSIFQGQKLKVQLDSPSAGSADSSSLVAVIKASEPKQKGSRLASTRSGEKSKSAIGRRTYEVQKGDTLYSITRKFNRLTVKELIRLNNLKNKQIKPGQQLIVG